jgi:serine/threonine protein kinase
MAEVESPDNPSDPDAPTQTRIDPLKGRTLNGRFRILEPIGAGGMGRVYKAVQQPLDRLVAVKVLHPQYSNKDTGFVRRFGLEASLTSKLRHPNTVTVIDYGQTDDGVFYIAMEYLEGRTVADVLLKDGPISWDRSLHIGQQVCRSLREAHKLGVIHRDLKPANVMLLDEADNDQVKVLDFGLVKSFVPEAPGGGDGQKITQAGMLLGSPQYMAPEQARNHSDPRSDVYSFGVLLYEMMTGKPPFSGKDYIEVIVKHMKEAPPPFHAVHPELAVPPAVEALVMRCLVKDANSRFQSMDEVLEGMRQIDGVRTNVSGAGPRPSGAYDLRTPPPMQLRNGTTPPPAQQRSPSGTMLEPSSSGSFPVSLSGTYPAPEGQQPSGPYAQPPRSGAYAAAPPPSGPYAAQPGSGPYARPPSGQYAQPPPSGAYAAARPPSGQYAQPPPSGAYAQPPSGPYAQPPSGPYAQPPSGPYAQPPPSGAYAAARPPSGQYPQPGSGQYPQPGVRPPSGQYPQHAVLAPEPATQPAVEAPMFASSQPNAGGGKGLVIALVLLLLVGGGAGTWYFGFRGPSTGPAATPPPQATAPAEQKPPEPAQATPPPAPTTLAGRPVRFKVQSDPAGARVFLGARDLGSTPLNFEMPAEADGTATAELVFILDGHHPLAATAGGSGDVLIAQRLQKKPSSGREGKSEGGTSSGGIRPAVATAQGSGSSSDDTVAAGFDGKIEAPTLLAADPNSPPRGEPPVAVAAASAPAPGPVNTGHDVLPFGEGMSRPQMLQGTPIQYSREAIQGRVEGLMIVKCVITTQGRVENCRILKSLPYMEKPVLDSLYSRTFKPITYQGRPVAVDYVFDVRLVLPKR